MMEDPRKEPNPLQELMVQFAGILNQLYDKKNKGSDEAVSDEIKHGMAYMKEMNLLLANLHRQALVKTGITEEELQKQLKEGMEELDPKSQEYFSKIEGMKRDIEKLRGFYKQKAEKLQENDPSDSTAAVKKKRDNIQVGMKRGWKKL